MDSRDWRTMCGVQHSTLWEEVDILDIEVRSGKRVAMLNTVISREVRISLECGFPLLKSHQATVTNRNG